MKKLKTITQKLTCTIILVYPNIKYEDKIKEEIKKYTDTYINVAKDKTQGSAFNVTVMKKSNIIGNFKLKYDYEHRRFIDYEGE